ncbi:MAG: aryl-sulfate sulfotransferase [Candidatus Acidiferrales bacterium]
MLSKETCVWVCLVAVTFIAGCASSPPAPPSISPSSAALSPGQTIQFNTTFHGSGTIWSVNSIAAGNSTIGTVDASGNYTAPSAAQSVAVTVTATKSNSSVSAQVFVVAPGTVVPTKNPQVALYTITPPAAASVTVQFGLTTNYGLSTWTQQTPAGGGSVGTFVAGMLANSTYHMQATVKFSNGISFADIDQTFTTESQPAASLPTLAATTTAGQTPQSGVEVLELESKLPVAVTDLDGNVLWGYDPGPVRGSGGPGPVKLLPNGHFLMGFGSQPDGTGSVIQEVDLGDNVVWQLTAAQLNQALAAATCTGCNITVIGTHHDFAPLPNGHLVVIAATQQVVSGTTVTGDVLIDLDQNHKPVWLWNEFDHLDINRRPYMFPDWTHTNAILYSADDGNLIISIRHQNWLVKIDYNNGAGTGDIIWHLGYQGDFTLLDADGSTDINPIDWFYAQHGPSFVTSNTTGKFSLVLFDNGDDRGAAVVAGGTCGVTGQPACYSTVPVLNLDETAKTATLAFNPTTPDYSFFGGNAEALINGDVEYDECAAGVNAAIFEVTQASPSQTVWQMHITGSNAYRGIRTPSLYPGVQW